MPPVPRTNEVPDPLIRFGLSIVALVAIGFVLAGCPEPEPYCALNPCDDGGSDAGKSDAGNISDAGAVDAGIPDGGYGSLTGSSAFQVKTSTTFARLLADGGPDFSRIGVMMASVNYPCQHPQNPIVGPGTGLALEGYSRDGGLGKATFTSSGSNIYLVGLNSDGGFPLGVDFAPAGPSSFTIDWGADPTKGVTGTVNATFSDGGTLQGTFAASYCGAY